MIYDNDHRSHDGVWHCPYPPEWVEKMKRAAKCCYPLSSENIEAALNRESRHYKLPPCDFLSEWQDARGLPMSWCDDYDRRHNEWPTCCTAIYDYDSIPDVVATNGDDDWPFEQRLKILQA